MSTEDRKITIDIGNRIQQRELGDLTGPRKGTKPRKTSFDYGSRENYEAVEKAPLRTGDCRVVEL